MGGGAAAMHPMRKTGHHELTGTNRSKVEDYMMRQEVRRFQIRCRYEPS